jgi:hypothetical protein
MSTAHFQLANVRFIKRIVVGNDSPTNPRSEAETQEAMALVNRCLSESPRGFVIGMEKNFGIYSIGEHQVVLQYVVYNIGFERKPLWLQQDD